MKETFRQVKPNLSVENTFLRGKDVFYLKLVSWRLYNRFSSLEKNLLVFPSGDKNTSDTLIISLEAIKVIGISISVPCR